MSVLLPAEAVTAIGLTGGVHVRKGGVTSLQTPGGKVWVKSVEPPTKVWRRTILAGLGRIFPVPILRPSKAGKGGDTLLLQADQAEKLRAAGLKTATIHYADKDFLVLADAGVNIQYAVRDLEKMPVARANIDRPAARAILLQITGVIAEMHRKGFAHGRPKMRDFAWQGDGADGTVTILDLEERPWEVMSMSAAQARDIYLWLVDLCSYPVPRETASAAMQIFDETMSGETRTELRKLRRLLSVLAFFVRLLTRTPLRKREMVGAVGAYDVLKAFLGNHPRAA